MKKIFYIVLVIVALMVISRFVKQGNQTVPSEVIAVEEVVPEAPKLPKRSAKKSPSTKTATRLPKRKPSAKPKRSVLRKPQTRPRKKRQPTPFPPNKPVKNCYKKVIIFDDLFYCISKKNFYIST